MPGTDLKYNARQQMRENAPKIFVVSIIFVVLLTVMDQLQVHLIGLPNFYDQYLQELAAGSLPTLMSIISYFNLSGIPFYIVLWLLASLIDVGFMSYGLKISRSQMGEQKDLFNGFLFPGKVILIKVVTNVLIFLWSFLLIFPGIAAYYRYRQAYYILLDDPKKSILQCIQESGHLMRGKKLDLFILDLSFIGWAFLNLFISIMLPLPFPLPLVSVFLVPYHGLTCAAFYNQLINRLAV